MEPIFLTLEDVLESHQEQIATYGGIDGIRDVGLLESALQQPQSSFGGEYLHINLFEMAAAYLFHLVKNHPFIDGNKRIGLEVALIFLEINGSSVEATDDQLVEMVLRTATGETDKAEIADFFRNHTTQAE
jgi:death on curing protein